ncbi:MAG: hypothetical protein AAGN46_00420 [Acidobacteriota bacterium]
MSSRAQPRFQASPAGPSAPTVGGLPRGGPPSRRKKLGQLLVERGRITGEQLIRAIQSQRVVGGRIGTCLLEMDVLSEDQLLDALADQLGVPSVEVERLRSISDETLAMIPQRVASRWRAVPFWSDDQEIKVAALEVGDLVLLDELRFCTDKRVQPHIVNEVRLFEALDKYYDVEIPRRYGYLLDRLNRARYLWADRSGMELGGTGLPTETPAPDAADWRQMGWDEPDWSFPDFALDLPTLAMPNLEPTSGRPEALRDALVPGLMQSPASHSPGEGSGVATSSAALPMKAPLSLPDLAAVDARLGVAAGVDEIGGLLLAYMRSRFTRSALFQARRDIVQGWRLEGPGAREGDFRALTISIGQPSIFATLMKGASFYLGPLAPLPAHRALADTWGGELPRQCLAMPIRMRDRLVAVLYGDCGADGLGDIDLATYRQLADKASSAFELCILRKKLRHA